MISPEFYGPKIDLDQIAVPRLTKPTVLPPEWFVESASGGSEEAWQTFASPRHPGFRDPPWHPDSAEMGYEQSYSGGNQYIHRRTLKKGPDWFESSIGHFDFFGRQRAPTKATEEFYVEWEVREENATLLCGEAGCKASANVTLPRSEREESKCFLDVLVHPTDFDDAKGREVVQWITANDQVVVTDCTPMASGCNPATARRWHACVERLGVDHMLDHNGSALLLSVEAQLSPLVDECPLEGYLLNGVVSLSCFVRAMRRIRPPPTTVAPKRRDEPQNETVVTVLKFNTSVQCKSP